MIIQYPDSVNDLRIKSFRGETLIDLYLADWIPPAVQSNQLPPTQHSQRPQSDHNFTLAIQYRHYETLHNFYQTKNTNIPIIHKYVICNFFLIFAH